MAGHWAISIIGTFVHFQKKKKKAAKSRNVETSLYTDFSTFKKNDQNQEMWKHLYKNGQNRKIFLIKMAEIGVSIIVGIPHCNTDKARAI